MGATMLPPWRITSTLEAILLSHRERGFPANVMSRIRACVHRGGARTASLHTVKALQKRHSRRNAVKVANYLMRARQWQDLELAADARDASRMFRTLRKMLHCVFESGWHTACTRFKLKSALQLSSGDNYPLAQPVCCSCLTLLTKGPVWSRRYHRFCPVDERLAASARTLMMDITRWDKKGEPYKVDIRSSVGRQDGIERFLPRDIWETIFSFLVFSEGWELPIPHPVIDISGSPEAKRRRIVV